MISIIKNIIKLGRKNNKRLKYYCYLIYLLPNYNKILIIFMNDSLEVIKFHCHFHLKQYHFHLNQYQFQDHMVI